MLKQVISMTVLGALVATQVIPAVTSASEKSNAAQSNTAVVYESDLELPEIKDLAAVVIPVNEPDKKSEDVKEETPAPEIIDKLENGYEHGEISEAFTGSSEGNAVSQNAAKEHDKTSEKESGGKPLPTVTEIKPVPTETQKETKPAPTETETKPAPTETETKPAPTVTETKPVPTVTETKPAPTVTETKPAPTETQKDTKPAPTETETKPAPTETQKDTKPATTETETKPAPTETENKPAPTETKPEASEGKTEKGSTASKTEKEESVNKTDNKESEKNTQKEPAPSPQPEKTETPAPQPEKTEVPDEKPKDTAPAKTASAKPVTQEEVAAEAAKRGNYGRIIIPEMGINVAVFFTSDYSKLQSIVDAKDSACMFKWNKGNRYVADHVNQDFGALRTKTASKLKIVTPDGTENYRLVEKVTDGWNKGTNLTYNDGTSITSKHQNCLVLYTCNPEKGSVTILVWERVN